MKNVPNEGPPANQEVSCFGGSVELQSHHITPNIVAAVTTGRCARHGARQWVCCPAVRPTYIFVGMSFAVALVHACRWCSKPSENGAALENLLYSTI